MDEEEKEWHANLEVLRHITNIGERMRKAEREVERLRAENAELRARLDRTETYIAAILKDRDELHNQLDKYEADFGLWIAHAQPPGFPQPDDDVELYIDRQAQADLMGFGDDEPVAGTA